MKVAALVDNLFFTSKISATANQSGCEVVFCRAAEEVTGDVEQVVVDLDGGSFDAVSQVRALRAARTVPIVAFVQHTHTELKQGAEEALETSHDSFLPKRLRTQAK